MDHFGNRGEILEEVPRSSAVPSEAVSTGAPEARNELAQAGRPGYRSIMMVSPGGATRLSHTYSQNHIHVVFSTKERQKLIRARMQPKLWAYMAGIARNHDFLLLSNGGIEDHVHLLIQLPATLALADAVSLLKSNSSRWMNEHGTRFEWQEGYGAFSVSASNLGKVERYIQIQAAHHKKITFEQEFISLLKKHKIDFDPKYVFG